MLGVQDGMAGIGVETDQVSASLFAAGFDELDRAQAALDRRDGISRSAGQRQADLFSEPACQAGRTDCGAPARRR